MAYYRPCPVCGAALDPGERCDCRNEARENAKIAPKAQHKKRSRPGAATPERPGGNRFADQHFQLHDSKNKVKNQGGLQNEWVMSLI